MRGAPVLRNIGARRPWVTRVLQRLGLESAFSDIEQVIGNHMAMHVHCVIVGQHDQGFEIMIDSRSPMPGVGPGCKTPSFSQLKNAMIEYCRLCESTRIDSSLAPELPSLPSSAGEASLPVPAGVFPPGLSAKRSGLASLPPGSDAKRSKAPSPPPIAQEPRRSPQDAEPDSDDGWGEWSGGQKTVASTQWPWQTELRGILETADGDWSMATWNPGTGSTLEIEAFVRDAYGSQVAVVNLQEFHDRISITGDWLQLRSDLGGRHLIILGHPKRIRSIARHDEQLFDDNTAWLSAVLTTCHHKRVYNVCIHIDHTAANPNTRGTSTKRQAILDTLANAIWKQWGAHDLHVLAGDFNQQGVSNRMHKK